MGVHALSCMGESENQKQMPLVEEGATICFFVCLFLRFLGGGGMGAGANL